MAKKLSKGATYLKLELEKEITCAVCQDYYLSPKVLPCGHYYCKQCIFKLSFKAGTAKSFPCPECRKDTKFPKGTVDALPTAFIVNRLKEMCTLEKSICKSDFKCDICSVSPEDKSITYCQKCNQFLCEGCLDSHDTRNGHKLLTVEEIDRLQQSKCMFDSSQKICEIHSEPLKLYCFDCNVLICRDCTVKNHKNHTFEFNILAAMAAKKDVAAQLKPLKEVDVKLTDAIKNIQEREKEVETQCASITTTIEASFKELHMELEKHQQQLLEEVRRKLDSKLDSLRMQEKSVFDANMAVWNLIHRTEHSTENSSDSDLMCEQLKMKEQIQQAIDTHSKPIYPTEEADLGIKIQCTDLLRQVCKENAKIIHLSMDLTVDRVPSSAKIDKAFEVHLQSSFNGKPAKCCTLIEACCKTLHDGSVATCAVENVAHGEYFITHTPTSRGRHEVTITNNGLPIASGPLQIFVSIHPSKLQNPVKILSGLNKPNGIAINSSGEIIVAELKGDILALDKEGQKINVLSRTEHKFHQLRSIAIDNDDNIYFADLANNYIFKSNKDFSKVWVKAVPQLGEQGHGYITVVGDEVMVCERHNKGKITVYDKELNYVRKIMHQSAREFCALSPDSHGNFYASIRDSSTIQVFSNNGRFIQSFQEDKSGVETPWSMFVSGQYIYVADTGLKKIIVLTKRGKFVSSFGHNLCSVCVDKDGFVYACNFIKGRIEIY